MHTLADYQKLETDMIMHGVYDWLFEEDGGILKALNVTEVEGNGIKYNVETTYPRGQWVDVGDTIVEDAGAYTQRSAAVYKLISDIDVDKFAMASVKRQNVEQLEMKRKVRGMLNGFHEQLVWGQTSTAANAKQPKGLLRLIAELESEATVDLDGFLLGTSGNNSQVVAQDVTSAALTLEALEIMMSAVRLKCNGLLLSRLCNIKINSLARAAGTPLPQERNEFNNIVQIYNGADMYISDHIPDNIHNGDGSSALLIASYTASTTRAASYDNTVIIGFSKKEEGLNLLQVGAWAHEPLGTREHKDAVGHRFKWYVGFGIFNKYGAAVLINCIPGTALT